MKALFPATEPNAVLTWLPDECSLAQQVDGTTHQKIKLAIQELTTALLQFLPVFSPLLEVGNLYRKEMGICYNCGGIERVSSVVQGRVRAATY